MNEYVEIFKDIPGYEGIYQVSNLGRVKSLKFNREKILKPGIDKKGYLHVVLYNEGKQKTKRLHQLVAMAFLDYTPDGTTKIVTDHIDNDRLNNRLSNLQLISNRHNCSKDRKGGTSKRIGVNWHKASNKWISRIKINGKQIFLGYFDLEEEASEYYQDALKSIENNTEIKVKEVVFSSKYKGVSWAKQKNKWISRIKINGKRKHLGLFKCELEASEYYQDALKSIKEGTEIKVKKVKTSSKYKGVCWDKDRNKWRSDIRINGKRKHLGLFKCELEAHHAYQKALNELNNK